MLAPTSHEYRPGAKLPIYRPVETNVAAATIVFVHGGGWANGNPEQLERHCRYYADQGFVAISLDYRLTREPGVTVADCVADVTAGLRWIREQAGELGIDPKRIVLAGESAGGQLAYCASLSENMTPASRCNLPGRSAMRLRCAWSNRVNTGHWRAFYWKKSFS